MFLVQLLDKGEAKAHSPCTRGAMLLSATHQVKLQTGAPFTAVDKIGGSDESTAMNARYSPVAAKCAP